MDNIIELLRKNAISDLFDPRTKSFRNAWEVWSPKIRELTKAKTPNQILDLGDNLSEVFKTTAVPGRSQSTVSGGGTAWEALVCWYLNLCLIGRRTIVIKHNKNLLPDPVRDAMTVNYANFVSNTESDLVAITFPDKAEYSNPVAQIEIKDKNGKNVDANKNSQPNVKELLNALSFRDFTELEIHIIQCKTNWNDNAQIPMLWDMVYSAQKFKSNITIGKNNHSIHHVSRFTYSFVTVPTSRLSGIKNTSTSVKRVTNLSGGNYWGRPSQSNVASSIKEMISRNLSTGHANPLLQTLKKNLPSLSLDFAYFNL